MSFYYSGGKEPPLLAWLAIWGTRLYDLCISCLGFIDHIVWWGYCWASIPSIDCRHGSSKPGTLLWGDQWCPGKSLLLFFVFIWDFKIEALLFIFFIFVGEPCFNCGFISYAQIGQLKGHNLRVCPVYRGHCWSRRPLLGPTPTIHSWDLCQQGIDH